jgi:hypothetical protein
MYYPVHRQDDTGGEIHHSPCPHHHITHHQMKEHHHCCSNETRTACPTKLPSGQIPLGNQPNRNTAGPSQHGKKTNHEHHHPHQDEMKTYPQVPFYVYPNIPYTAKQTSHGDHKYHRRNTSDEDQKPPVRHNSTCPHAHNHQHCHSRHVTHPANHANEGHGRSCYNHGEDAKPPHAQPKTCSHSPNTATHQNGAKSNDASDENQCTCQCHRYRHHTSSQPVTKWVWGPPLPGFFVGPPMDAPKYKRG